MCSVSCQARVHARGQSTLVVFPMNIGGTRNSCMNEGHLFFHFHLTELFLERITLGGCWVQWT